MDRKLEPDERAKARERIEREPWITSLHTVDLSNGKTATTYAKDQRAAELVYARFLQRIRATYTVVPRIPSRGAKK